MVDISRASQHALKNFAFNAGAFYGSAQGLSLGVGLIYDRICFPLYDDEDGLFDTVEGMVYVLTHECDLDQANERHFNKHVLICPVIKFEEFADDFISAQSEGALFGIIPDIAQNNIFRLFYLPPIPRHVAVDVLPYGGILFMNQICSTHVNVFVGEPVCALSMYAVQRFDLKLQNHLFRPKAELLPRLM